MFIFGAAFAGSQVTVITSRVSHKKDIVRRRKKKEAKLNEQDLPAGAGQTRRRP